MIFWFFSIFMMEIFFAKFAKISLTNKGQTLVGKLKEEYADLHGEMLKDLTVDERDKIYEGISLMQGLVSTWLVKNN